MRTRSAATKLLDRVDGWERIYSDDIATIHLRKAGAVHTVNPAVDSKSK
jgi:GTP-dependent phosphoenolpyruvate carboxykinase